MVSSFVETPAGPAEGDGAALADLGFPVGLVTIATGTQTFCLEATSDSGDVFSVTSGNAGPAAGACK